MGAATGNEDEQPVHPVRLTRAFYVGKYEVTFAEYDQFCTETVGVKRPPDNGQGRGTRPVMGVTWPDAVAYCNWLSAKAGLTPCYSGKGRLIQCDFAANGYRLPTEAEWEYAARGGQLSRGYLYAGGNNPDDVAWYNVNAGGQAHPVGQKQPNELGLYDMSGNAWEWCWDLYEANYYATSPASDPTGPTQMPAGQALGPERVRRSSGSLEDARSLRVTCRSSDAATYAGANGFRLVRTR
jgi:formylglycine-generating enzyme required for sulfatase activity